jgi:hypothetical protein
VLDGIITFFHEKSERQSNNENEMAHSFLEDDDAVNDLKELQSVQGTTLLHVIFAVKQDQALGKEFLKYLKVPN